jgi:hypothetical protein
MLLACCSGRAKSSMPIGSDSECSWFSVIFSSPKILNCPLLLIEPFPKLTEVHAFDFAPVKKFVQKKNNAENISPAPVVHAKMISGNEFSCSFPMWNSDCELRNRQERNHTSADYADCTDFFSPIRVIREICG